MIHLSIKLLNMFVDFSLFRFNTLRVCECQNRIDFEQSNQPRKGYSLRDHAYYLPRISPNLNIAICP